MALFLLGLSTKPFVDDEEDVMIANKAKNSDTKQ
jgi:hypothetical protein